MTTFQHLNSHRVLIASLFLPYTVDFHLSKDKAKNYTKPQVDQVATSVATPNLIETLAAQQNPSARAPPTPGLEDKLFDFRNDTPSQPLVQPKSRSRQAEVKKKLPSLNTSQPKVLQRRKSLDSARVFAEAPWTIEPCKAGNIGLQNAINSVAPQLKKHVWIGTLGMPTETLEDKTRADIKTRFITEHDCYPVMAPDAEFEGHYEHYCKQVLWPNFHYVMLENPKSKVYQDDTWKAYQTLNERFADTIAEIYQPGDTIWVNDYHLMLLPALLRERLPNAIIGFFLHIPFPSSEIFRCLPTRKELLEGVLKADLVGFQTYSFARHFLQTCSRILSLEANPSGIQMDSHYVSIGIFPIGIDIASLNEKRKNPDVDRWMEVLKEKYAGKKIIVARDKLDSIKGVRQKMLAFEKFLTNYPEWHGQVVLIQVALSTTEQNELQAHITDVVSRVNSKFSNIAYQPIVFLHQDISFSQYLALLTNADAALITPLRDGMNLTSHEYIACQQANHGPLILSEFTGTYGTFGACLRVNPWDYSQVSVAIHEALSMGEEEKDERWQSLYQNVATNTAQYWAGSFISELEKANTDTTRRYSTQIPLLNSATFQEIYAKGKKRLFLLDYDGTLAAFNKTPQAFSSPHRIHSILKKINQDPNNVIYVTSGRSKENLDEQLGKIPNIGLSAENGAYLKTPNGQWEDLFTDVDVSWKPAVMEIFDYYTERTPGSFIENKDISIVWHYRMADHPQYGAWQAAECQNHIMESIGKSTTVHAIAGNQNIEVIPKDINKTAVAVRVLQTVQPDFIMAVGDDRADEELFAYINKLDVPNVVTCTVGAKSTEALYFVNGVQSVLNILETLPNRK
ncbi:Trehalose-6-P synthase/phosphatase complex subunit [Umbelopsis sp. WA50703]